MTAFKSGLVHLELAVPSKRGKNFQNRTGPNVWPVGRFRTVAREKLGRDLSVEELTLVEDKIGDYFDWHGPIASAIEDCVENSPPETTIARNFAVNDSGSLFPAART